jgi:argininosuccinate lyase
MAKRSPNSHKPEQESAFPAPIYAETVLAVNFSDAKRFFLNPLLEIHYAHTLMLARQGINSVEDSRTLLRALDGLDRSAIQAQKYDGKWEDLFFYVEGALAAAVGAEAAGRMHTARSRNDIDLTLYRMCLRRELLKAAAALVDARAVLLELAASHTETLMPAYTHTQPAQPTTLAHYLLAAVEYFGRDFERLRAAFVTVNRNPLGACAITTTGFPIDRNYTAELLGFEGLQINSYGAIGAIDYVTEAASALAVCMVNLGKLAHDLLLWCTAEFNFLRLSDAYVQTSSIMPQKRNPVALEHARILASKAFSQAQAILTCAHNTPSGDIVDSEDDLQPLVFSCFADGSRALKLFAGLMCHAQVNFEHMEERAQGDFLTVTELADTLVRSEHLSFRQAHQLVHQAVLALDGKYNADQMVQTIRQLAPESVGRKLEIDNESLRRALDARNFVNVRQIRGGPAPVETAKEIELAKDDLRASREWLQSKNQLLEAYPQRIRQEAARVMASGK